MLVRRIVDALQLNNLGVFIHARNRFTCRFDKLQAADTKRVITVLTTIFVQGLVDADLGMRQEFFFGEIR